MFFSLDESTDVFRLEQCRAFIRFSIRGEIFTKYLDVNSVVRPNAEQITECILKMMEKNLNWFPPKQEDILTDELFTQHINNQENGNDTIDDEVNNDADYESIIVDNEVGCESAYDKQGDDLNDSFEGEDQFNEYDDISNAFEDNRRMEIPEPSAPLLASITTDGANVLKGKRLGVSARLRSTCNNLMLNSHFISYRCQLELKNTAEKCNLCTEVDQFLEKLFVFHKMSNVVTNTYRQSVAKLDIPGSVSVIRVNTIRWVSHTLNALTNLFNGIQAHLDWYNTLIGLEKYSNVQKAKVHYVVKNLKDKKFLSFMIFMRDILEAV